MPQLKKMPRSRHDQTSRQPTNLKQDVSVPVLFQSNPVPPVPF
jgi:hypothetical protein